MTGRNWTELFFLDEAAAMAAGHRPCAYCRRKSYTAFRNAWAPKLKAPEIDTILHHNRCYPGARRMRHHTAQVDTLPAGTFIIDDGIGLLSGDALLPYSPSGYSPPRKRPIGLRTVLTSPPMIDALRGGYAPTIHPSAQIPLFP